MRSLRLFLFSVAMTFISMNSPALAQTATEKPKVVLLVSLDPALYPRGIAAWFHNYRNYPQKLESIFRGAFSESQYDVQVIQNATIYDLYQVLHADTTAVFWVSHEAPASWTQHPGVAIDPLLVDHHRADVKSIFKEINPKIRWVSLVACESNLVINWLKNQDQSVQMQGFDRTIDAKKGLKQALGLSREVLSTEAPAAAPCVTESGLRLTLTRTLFAAGATGPAYFPAVMINQGENILGVFPEARLGPGESITQQQTIYAPSAANLDVESGFDPAAIPENFRLGTFEVNADWNEASWKVFSKPDGTPFGVTDQVLMYSGQNADQAPLQNYHPYECN